MKIRSTDAAFHVATDGRTDMTTLIDAFRNFANAPKKYFSCFYVALTRKRLWMRFSDWLLDKILSRTPILGGGVVVTCPGYDSGHFRSQLFPPFRKSSVWCQWGYYQSDDSGGTVSLMTVSVLSVWWQWLYCQPDDSDCTVSLMTVIVLSVWWRWGYCQSDDSQGTVSLVTVIVPWKALSSFLAVLI